MADKTLLFLLQTGPGLVARIKSKVPGTREHRALKGTGGVKKHIPGMQHVLSADIHEPGCICLPKPNMCCCCQVARSC